MPCQGLAAILPAAAYEATLQPTTVSHADSPAAACYSLCFPYVERPLHSDLAAKHRACHLRTLAIALLTNELLAVLRRALLLASSSK